MGEEPRASSIASSGSSTAEEDPDDFLRGHIFALLARTRLPLAPFHIRRQLVRRLSSDVHREWMEELNDNNVGRLCRRIETTSGVLGSWIGAYFLQVRVDEMKRNALISEEYQRLGLGLLDGAPASAVVAVHADAEHRFLEPKDSSIHNAGQGLFLRQSRMLRQGTVLCEYRGRHIAAPPRNVALCPYMVEITTPDAAGNRYIDGVDELGNILCLAALINDRGTDGANAEFVEYGGLPGRVFVVSMRDINPGEEIFVSYGQSYWDEEKSREKLGRQRAKRTRQEAPQWQRCRKCRVTVPNRLYPLHLQTCNDSLAAEKVSELDPLPRNEFTSFDDQMPLSLRFRTDIKLLSKRCMAFVDPADSATYATTHVDVVHHHRVEVIHEDVTLIS
jgi:hypothetical protein